MAKDMQPMCQVTIQSGGGSDNQEGGWSKRGSPTGFPRDTGHLDTYAIAPLLNAGNMQEETN